MLHQRSSLSVALLGAALVFGNSPSVGAGEPTERIRAAVDRGIEVLKGANLDTPKSKAHVIDRLREIVYPLFDFEEMAKRSLGQHWRGLSPQQQKEFVAVFTDLLEKTYAERVDLYNGQKVVYARESVEKHYAEVGTRLIGKGAESYSVLYKLHSIDGKWRIYDVVAENISLVNNYRSQFQRVIVNSSFQDLIERMKQKAS